MFNKKINQALMGSLLVFGLTLSSQATAAFTAGEAAELTAEAKATLEKFKADTKGSEGVFSKAKGILVCPKIRKAGLGIGVERGKCVLAMGAEGNLYYQTSSLKAGAIIGAASHSMILVLNTDETLAKFTSGTREWEFGIDASVAVAKVGVGGELDTTNLKKDIVSFIFGEKGLIGDLSWEGSNFKKLDVE
ncbi:MAG: lipid-binding SYLF domain-containing protein [Pseudomonadota bacterium]|nr:lipid-binding SYLF domain-containing protein [Pseudomonadota bacterium]